MGGDPGTADGHEHPAGEEWPPVECFRCGVCCTRYQPPLFPGEIETIAAGLGMSPDGFLSRYAQLTNVGYLLRQAAGECVFLVREGGGAKASCGIYSFRPRACRDWTASLSRPECRQGLTLKAKAC